MSDWIFSFENDKSISNFSRSIPSSWETYLISVNLLKPGEKRASIINVNQPVYMEHYLRIYFDKQSARMQAFVKKYLKPKIKGMQLNADINLLRHKKLFSCS